ncbi:ribosomal biogenesis protein LAS1L-like [Monodelphis domestica]|nr:ribosomal biogenesis protein LAS1L-like [Monodelphis domestica]
MDIPEWIVNLRHDFTHRKLPRLNTCRRGCDFVLDWLRRTYWCRQLGNDLSEPWDSEMDFHETETDGEERAEPHVEDHLSKEARRERELHEKIRRVLVSFEEEQFRVLREVRQLPKAIKVWGNSSTEVEWIVSKMKKLTQDHGTVVVDILLSDGFLIPTAEQLETLQIQQTRTVNLNNLTLARSFSHFWQPLLKGLESQPFTQAILEKMLSLLPESGDTGIRPAYLISWINELLIVYGSCVDHFTSSQRAIRKTWKVVCHNFSLDWSQVLDVCLDCACWATLPILQLLLKTMEPAFPLETQENLLCLCTIYTQGGNPNTNPRSRDGSLPMRRPVYTLEDLQWQVRQTMLADRRSSCKPGEEKEIDTELQELYSKTDYDPKSVRRSRMRERPEVLAEKQAALKGSAWQLCTDDVDWSKYPLGRVPGQTDDPNELMLNNYTMMSAVNQPTVQENDNLNSAATHSSENLLWTQGELHRIKNNIKFF